MFFDGRVLELKKVEPWWRRAPVSVFTFQTWVGVCLVHGIDQGRGEAGRDNKEAATFETKEMSYLWKKWYQDGRIKDALCLALSGTQHLSSITCVLCIYQLLLRWSKGKGFHALLGNLHPCWGQVKTHPQRLWPKAWWLRDAIACSTCHRGELLWKWQYFCSFLSWFGMGHFKPWHCNKVAFDF